MKVRPPRNYHWRTDPYIVNGSGDPKVLVADLRVAYWFARWVRVGP